MDDTTALASNGGVEISFKMEDKPKSSKQYLKGVPIMKFDEHGNPVYAFSDKTGHKFFDFCDCNSCREAKFFDDDLPKRRKNKSQQRLKEMYEAGDLEVDLLGEPSEKTVEYYVRYPRRKPSNRPFRSPSKETTY